MVILAQRMSKFLDSPYLRSTLIILRGEQKLQLITGFEQRLNLTRKYNQHLHLYTRVFHFFSFFYLKYVRGCI